MTTDELKSELLVNELVAASIAFGRGVEPDWQTRIETAQRELREYIEGLEAGIHDETVPEKFDENISALQEEFSMRFENESPVEFFRAIRAGQYPTPPEVQE